MKNEPIKYLLFILMMTLFSSALRAEINGGVIRFDGGLYQDGCDVTQQKRYVSFSCVQKGKRVIHSIGVNQVNNYRPRSDSAIQTSLRYLDSARSMAIVEMSYR